MVRILWIIAAIVLAFWLVGLLMSWGGNLIHLLLIVVVAIIIINVVTGRRAI